jgi:putative oxidoreductase
MFLFHGWAKLSGGPETWATVGDAMQNLGITFLPAMWGFFAAFSESICSLLLALGVLFRPAAALLSLTMFVAVLNHLNLPPESPRSGWSGASHALELLSVYVAFLLAGPGRYGLSLGTREPKA